MYFDYAAAAVAITLALIAVVAFPQIVRDACHPIPPEPSPAVERFCKLIYEANRRPGPRIGQPIGYLRPGWMNR